MSLFRACLLLALAAATLADAVSKCSETDASALRDTLRQSACRLSRNATERGAFVDSVLTKHGASTSTFPYHHFPVLFVPTLDRVWCRSPYCPSFARENVTWCVNIAYPEREVETCIKLVDDKEVTNSTCEAELVGISNGLGLPSTCPYAGDAGCLGMTNLDWFYAAAVLTCTVQTDTCYSKSFTALQTRGGVSRPPEVEVFPPSPMSLLASERLILHVEVTTTTERTTVIWQYNDSVYSSFIFEDPFCNAKVEECRYDPHPNAVSLRQGRIKAYRTTRIVQLDGCQTGFIYRLETYLIIENTTEKDSGEYIFNMTSTHASHSPITVARGVNVSISTLVASSITTAERFVSALQAVSRSQQRPFAALAPSPFMEERATSGIVS
jgi:hypothetical protein